MPQGEYKTIIITEVREVVKGFKAFVFEEGHGIRWKAGQYLTLVRQEGGEEIRRSYSIIASPELDEPLGIGVKRVENGVFSRRLVDEARPGDRLLTTGTGGLFILPDNLPDYSQVFFFAAGSGITPVFSLLKTLLHTHASTRAVLVFSNPSPGKTIFYEELKLLEQQFPERFRLLFLFSNSPNLRYARLYREHLLELLQEHNALPPEQCLFYVCGPEAYMRMCIYTLREQGVPPENIKRENFITYNAKPPKAEPPDKNAYSVTIRSQGTVFQFTSAYPDTILSAAKKQGIILPYSCEAGRCGNCAARCLHGNVWMSYNEVLTPRDLQSGLILTCTGYPVGGNVVLEV
ncbi:MAG TPA: ferredoxin--NADP reductase [Flavisolibacter sp.]|jgi:ring-1,2-phenylacetyl-CoA epoxidase subunit PaaE